MAGKKALGSWDVNDKRTKAGKEKHLQTNGVKMFDATVGIAGNLFGKSKKKKPIKKSNSYKETYDYPEKELTEEEKQLIIEKDKKSLPYIIGLAIICVVLVIFFWIFIISLF
ncbi:hypothetical protein [Flavobacterium sp.]|uniref:hypothetical protein n=1 Tax=Flavobacterium sp. TaxID=239 RepID=UPI0038D0061E